MKQINGITRTAAKLKFEHLFPDNKIIIGTKGFNRVGWKHEHAGMKIIGEFSPGSASAKDRVVFAAYGRER